MAEQSMHPALMLTRRTLLTFATVARFAAMETAQQARHAIMPLLAEQMAGQAARAAMEKMCGRITELLPAAILEQAMPRAAILTRIS